ncbi:MAG: SEC-C metal-binding domain-containing protein, partial [Betaproteobacteria bacterium]
MHSHHLNRNDPCSCGSGKRYKHCHGRIESANPRALHLEALAAHRSGSLT